MREGTIDTAEPAPAFGDEQVMISLVVKVCRVGGRIGRDEGGIGWGVFHTRGYRVRVTTTLQTKLGHRLGTPRCGPGVE